jgi:RsmE family RNA methyltransferase
VQKNTEIGIQKIIVFPADFSQNTIFLTDKKLQRLKKIAIEACEQSNNNIIPTIEIVNQIDFGRIQEHKNIFLHT